MRIELKPKPINNQIQIIMKKTLLSMAVLALMLIATGCKSSSTGDDDKVDLLVGKWVSTGTNVAPGLAGPPFNTARIDAEFFANKTYNVVQLDNNNAAVTFRGTWEAGEANPAGIRPVTLTQTEPVAVVAQGIFQIQGTNMTYEVIQVQPALEGVGAPTVQGGFGSTSILGNPTGGFWTQRYVRTN
jgi:hypothetical protein